MLSPNFEFDVHPPHSLFPRNPLNHRGTVSRVSHLDQERRQARKNRRKRRRQPELNGSPLLRAEIGFSLAALTTRPLMDWIGMASAFVIAPSREIGPCAHGRQRPREAHHGHAKPASRKHRDAPGGKSPGTAMLHVVIPDRAVQPYCRSAIVERPRGKQCSGSRR